MTKTEATEAARTHAKARDTSTGAVHTVLSATQWPFVLVRKESGHNVRIIGSVLEKV